MGLESLIGETAEAYEPLNPTGRVFMQGELWNAVSLSGSILQGEKLRVRDIKNMTLYVEQLNP